VQELAADNVQLDQRLARFGPETTEIRTRLRDDVSRVHAIIWSPEGAGPAALDPVLSAREFGAILGRIQDLVPKTDAQHNDQVKALEIGSTIERTRLLMFVATTSRVPLPFLIVLVSWLAALFLGFGLFARFNLTVTVSLLIGAMSIAAATLNCGPDRAPLRPRELWRHRLTGTSRLHYYRPGRQSDQPN
jgi:hypothetical protein